MQYREVFCSIAPDQEEELHNRFAVLGFCSYAITTDYKTSTLSIYAAAADIPPAVHKILVEMELPVLANSDQSEAELLAETHSHHAFALTTSEPVFTVSPDQTGPHTILIPPSPAFGDGRHPATRLAAELICQAQPVGESILDLGCGTGILGILALKLGASAVDFCDYDADSVRATGSICNLNGIINPTVFSSDLLADVTQHYSFLIANIYADLLEQLLPSKKLRETVSGDCVLSGIHERHHEHIRTCITDAGYRIQAHLSEEHWHAFWIQPL